MSLLAAWAAPVRQAAAQTYAPLGVFVGGVDDASFGPGYAAFQSSLGQSANLMDIYIDYTHSMPTWPTSGSYSAENMQLNAPTMTPVVAIGIMDYYDVYGPGPYNESNAIAMMNAVAAGTYDATFAGVINSFASDGFTSMDLRIGWEQDGTWYPWQATRDAATAAAYVAAWQHIADIAHNLVPGYPVNLTVKTVWSPSEVNWTAVPVTTTYPGDAYADIIGPDCYSNVWNIDLENWGTHALDGNQNACAANPINREHYWDYPNATQWSPTSSGGWGIAAGIAFAKAHGKPFAISEAGAGNNGTSTGPVDDAQFPFYLANRLSSAMEQGVPIAFANVWDVDSAGNWNFSDGTKPNEAAAWYQFVGTMAAAQMASEPFGVDYAIGTASSTPGSGAGPYSLAGAGTGYGANSTADNFNFIALPQEGDGSFVMQLTSQSIRQGQTGVMLRAGMRPGDAYAALYVSGAQCIFIGRTATGAVSTQIAQVPAMSTPWLKIQRVGSVLIGCQSTDGVTWTFVGSEIIPTPVNAYIGAAIASGSATDNIATVNYVNLPNDVIVDNAAAITTGKWSTTTSSSLGYGGSYLTDGNNSASKAAPSTVSYTPNLGTAGNYDIYAWYTPGSTNGGPVTRANNIPLTVSNANGSAQLTLDETAGLACHWNYVGTAAMVAGTGNTVTISNAGTTQTVVADALMFVLNPTPAGAMVGSVTPAPAAVNLSPANVVDWSHWGGTPGTPSTAWDHATLTTPLISNWSAIGTGGSYGATTSVGYCWTGSEGPNPTTMAATRCIYRQGMGLGYQFTVTTGTVPQLLNVYVGRQWFVTGQLQVLNSANTVIYSNSISGSYMTRCTSDYTLRLGPNSTYTIQYTEPAGTGNIDIEAATLSNTPY